MADPNQNGINEDLTETNLTAEVLKADSDKNVADPGNSSPNTETPGKKVWNIVKKLAKRWFIDAFSGMAQGLFCTLIAGTILAQFAGWILLAETDAGQAVGNFVNAVANIAKALTGAGIGVGIAHALKAPKLVMFSAAVAGLAGGFQIS